MPRKSIESTLSAKAAPTVSSTNPTQPSPEKTSGDTQNAASPDATGGKKAKAVVFLVIAGILASIVGTIVFAKQKTNNQVQITQAASQAGNLGLYDAGEEFGRQEMQSKLSQAVQNQANPPLSELTSQPAETQPANPPQAPVQPPPTSPLEPPAGFPTQPAAFSQMPPNQAFFPPAASQPLPGQRNPEVAKQVENEIRSAHPTVYVVEAKAAPASVPTGTNPKPRLLIAPGTVARATIRGEVLASPQRPRVMAILAEPVRGDIDLPVGTTINGQVSGYDDKRIYVNFTSAKLPDGTVVAIAAGACDGKKGGDGLVANGQTMLGNIGNRALNEGVNMGLSMVRGVTSLAGAFTGGFTGGYDQYQTGGNQFGVRQPSAIRVFKGGDIQIYFKDTAGGLEFQAQTELPQFPAPGFQPQPNPTLPGPLTGIPVNGQPWPQPQPWTPVAGQIRQ